MELKKKIIALCSMLRKKSYILKKKMALLVCILEDWEEKWHKLTYKLTSFMYEIKI